MKSNFKSIKVTNDGSKQRERERERERERMLRNSKLQMRTDFKGLGLGPVSSSTGFVEMMTCVYFGHISPSDLVQCIRCIEPKPSPISNCKPLFSFSSLSNYKIQFFKSFKSKFLGFTSLIIVSISS